MTVQQRPIHRPGSPESAHDESAYAAFAAAQFRILKDYMALAKLNTCSRVVTLANGVVITCKKSFAREDIFISVPETSFTEVIVSVKMGLFLFNHPAHAQRSLLYDFNATEDSGQTRDRAWNGGDKWKASFGSEADDYGNTDWKGSNGTILCWKGVASRHFQVDPLVGIAGYMIYDEEVVIDNYATSMFTPFSPDIYRGGDVFETIPNGGASISVGGALQAEPDLDEFGVQKRDANGELVFKGILTLECGTPPKVLGCAITKVEGVSCLVAAVGRNYRDTVNPESTLESPQFGGMFTEFYAKTGSSWVRFHYEQSPRHLANWFFNQSGTEAHCVQDKTVFKVVISSSFIEGVPAFTATYTAVSAASGTATEAMTQTSEDLQTYDAAGFDYWDYSLTENGGGVIGGAHNTSSITITDNQTCIEAIDYIDDVKVEAVTTYAHNSASNYYNTTSTTAEWITEYYLGEAEGKRFAPVGSVFDGGWAHVITSSIVLAYPNKSCTLFSRSRTASVTYINEQQVNGAYSIQPPRFDQTTSSSYQVNPSVTSEYYCEMKEKQDITNNDIRFLDLRHDILVRKETTYSFDESKRSTDAVQWSQYGAVLWLHKVKPGDIDITKTESILLNDEVVDTLTSPVKSEIDYTFAFPVYSGTPLYNSDESYYLWTGEQRDADGGYDLYFPSWLQGISTTTVDLDTADKTRHLSVSVNQSVIPTAASSGDLTYFETKVGGSWAVSPIKYGDINLKAYTTLKLDNNAFKNYVFPAPEIEGEETEETATNRLYGNPATMPTPIAPL